MTSRLRSLSPPLPLPLEAEDDAVDNIHVEARKLRPVNKEVEDQMSYFVRERKEIIRNLPLNAYGLQDSVSTKAVSLCHNLASNIKIEMFSPNNLKTSVTGQKQTASCKDGKLVVEMDDSYGELTSVLDVLKAWNTLDCVWQKIFPEWPVAKIALRVIFNMKNFAHCGVKARDVAITYSNRLLAKNSSLAANRKGPLTYERAFNLAGNVAIDAGFEREPPAGRSTNHSALSNHGGHSSFGPTNQRGGRGGGGAGRGAGQLPGSSRVNSQQGGGGKPKFTPEKLADGSPLCHFYNKGVCLNQNQGDCQRREGLLKHLCSYRKAKGYMCGLKHAKIEHDKAKHGE